VTVGDACTGVALERFLQVGVDVERYADQRRVVRIDDGARAVPDLDPDDLVAQGGTLQPLVDLRDLVCSQPTGELLLVEQGLDSRLGDQRGARTARRQIASLDVGVQLLGDDRAQGDDRYERKQPEAEEVPERFVLDAWRGRRILVNDAA